MNSREGALRKALPSQTVTRVQDLADAHLLRFEDAVFVALLKVGLSATQAYLAGHPGVTNATARSQGSRWRSRLSDTLETIDVETAMVVLADWAQVRAMTHPLAETALKGADQFNRTRDRYGEKQKVTTDPFQALLELARTRGRGGGVEATHIDTIPSVNRPPQEVIDVDAEVI